jgi:hypothetical protein
LSLLRGALGVALGILTLEATLRANPRLLLRGMALPVPEDPPLTVREYDVRPSDADVFYWIREQIRPTPPAADRVEAHVRFETDEFGFPNAGKLPSRIDVVVLGRSYSLGAQTEAPWPLQLARITGWRVLNLSQAGSGIDTKEAYLAQFGLPRHPRWVVVEVLPSMDVLDFRPMEPWLVQRAAFPVAQTFLRSLMTSRSGGADPVYPVELEVPGRVVSLTFFPSYLAALTIDDRSIALSNQWVSFTAGLNGLAASARAHGACVAVLYAPTNADVYVPMLVNISQLDPVTPGLAPWVLDTRGDLIQDASGDVDLNRMRANAMGLRSLLSKFAEEHGMVFIDPTMAMQASALEGYDPFMTYDTHWSAFGHRLVSEQVETALRAAPCR